MDHLAVAHVDPDVIRTTTRLGVEEDQVSRAEALEAYRLTLTDLIVRDTGKSDAEVLVHLLNQA